jgi:signal transduction histidine kinase
MKQLAPPIVVDYHAMQAGSPDASLLLDLDSGRLVDANQNAAVLFGHAERTLARLALADLLPPAQSDGRTAALVIDQLLRRASGADGREGSVLEARFLRRDGATLDCEIRMLALPAPGRRLLHMRVLDISGRRLAEALRSGQSALLETIARGGDMQTTLDQLAQLIESQSDGVLCSVMLLDEDRVHTRCVSAPSLPSAFAAALAGLPIGPFAGSCGTAMYRREAVVVSDIRADPLWSDYRALAETYGLRACWSIPILQHDQVLGSFAMYCREARSPAAEDLRLIDIAIHIARIAIEHSRHETELLRHREHLEELVAARTFELTRANGQLELANTELATALENLSFTQDELVRRDKLAALGALVAGVAHELNTPIGNSLVVASAMAERTGRLREVMHAGLRRSMLAAYLDDAAQADALILRNLQRAADLVSSFKQIAVDRASSQRRRFCLSQFIEELILPLQVPYKNTGLVVERDIASGLVMDSYPGPLGQVLSSLFENCVLHGFGNGPGGTIAIRARQQDDGDIVLTVSDDGAGIPAANLGRIYDPFFTTKLGSGGSGLGLHIAHNIVTGVLGGRIDVSSHVANGAGSSGTAFTLALPANAPLAAGMPS